MRANNNNDWYYANSNNAWYYANYVGVNQNSWDLIIMVETYEKPFSEIKYTYW